MDKKEFLAKLKQYEVGVDFRKKSAPMIERLFEKGVDEKSQKEGMAAVIKIFKSQADFKKSSDKVRENLKKLSAKNASKISPKKKIW